MIQYPSRRTQDLALLLALAVILAACSSGCSRPGTQPAEPATKNGSVSNPDPNAGRQSGQQSAATGSVFKPPEAAASPVQFHGLPPDSGFDFTRFDDQQGQWRILEANGGGVAVLDLDLDAWPDVFLTNGCRIPVSRDDQSTPGRLFRNQRQLKFTDVSESSGLKQFGLGYGCAVADADEDGFDDLYVTRYGGNQFWRNNGDGTFTEVAAANGTLSGDWGSSAAFADLNHDGWQDLYVVNYLRESDTAPRLCPEPNSPTGFIGCSPALFPGVPDRVFLADGAGNYIDASASAGLGQFPGKGLGVVICDLDGDRRSEIYVANDGEANFLFVVEVLPAASKSNIPEIRLHEKALEANAALNELGYAQASMGIAAGDLDRNGRTDLFLTHFYGDTNTLYLNHSTPGQLSFQDATRASALGPPSRQKLGFGTLAEDFDGDGWDDIFVANGYVDDRSWMQGGQPFQMLPQLFINQNGRFADVSASAGEWFNQPWLGRGAAAADFNRDGHLDLVVSCQLAPAAILINHPASTNAPTAAPETARNALVRPVGTASCRTPWGTQLTRSNQPALQQFLSGESFQSATDRVFLLPLSPDNAGATIHWPSGNQEKVSIVPGEFLLMEGRGLFELKD